MIVSMILVSTNWRSPLGQVSQSQEWDIIGEAGYSENSGSGEQVDAVGSRGPLCHVMSLGK